MNKKKIIILILGIIVFILIVVLLRNCIVNNKILNEEDIETEVDYYEFTDERWAIGYEVAKKNGDWSKLPLSEEFRKKYNEKDGILGKEEYDKIEYAPMWAQDFERLEDHVKFFVITQGKKKTAYTYIIFDNDDGLVDDVYLFEKIILYDEDGNALGIPKYTYFSYNMGIESYFKTLAYGGDEADIIEVTDNFRKKYPNFIDLFIRYSPGEYNILTYIFDDETQTIAAITYDKENNVFVYEDMVAKMEIDSLLEKVKRYYKVVYSIDEEGFLDDATATLLREEKYEGRSDNDRGYVDDGAKIWYPHSDWSGIKVTDNFRKKFNPETGIFPDSELYDYGNGQLNGLGTIYDGWGLYYCLLNDGQYHYYASQSIYVLRKYTDRYGDISIIEYLDDVLWKKLPYVEKHHDEEKILKLYLKSKGLPKDYIEQKKIEAAKKTVEERNKEYDKEVFFNTLRMFDDKIKTSSYEDIEKEFEKQLFELNYLPNPEEKRQWLKEYYDLKKNEK